MAGTAVTCSATAVAAASADIFLIIDFNRDMKSPICMWNINLNVDFVKKTHL
jgi:hypothetical protein